MGVDRAHGVVEVEGRHRVAELQVGLVVGADRPDVLPVAAEEVGLHAHLADRLRDHVAPEVDERRVGDRPVERLAREHVDAHRGQEAAAVARDLGLELVEPLRRRLLLEVHDPALPVHLQDAEAGGLLAADRHHGDGRVRDVPAVGLLHLPVVHLVQLVAREHRARRGCGGCGSASSSGARRRRCPGTSSGSPRSAPPRAP